MGWDGIGGWKVKAKGCSTETGGQFIIPSQVPKAASFLSLSHVVQKRLIEGPGYGLTTAPILKLWSFHIHLRTFKWGCQGLKLQSSECKACARELQPFQKLLPLPISTWSCPCWGGIVTQ